MQKCAVPGAFPVSCHKDVQCLPGFKRWNWVMGSIWEDCSYLPTALMLQQEKQLVLSQPRSGCVWHAHTSLSLHFSVFSSLRKYLERLPCSSTDPPLCVCESTLHKITFALANKYDSQKLILFLFAVSSIWNMQYLIEVNFWEKGRGRWRENSVDPGDSHFSRVAQVSSL